MNLLLTADANVGTISAIASAVTATIKTFLIESSHRRWPVELPAGQSYPGSLPRVKDSARKSSRA
jgi:hypothetical protein